MTDEIQSGEPDGGVEPNGFDSRKATGDPDENRRLFREMAEQANESGFRWFRYTIDEARAAMKSSAERKQAERERRREAGLVRVELWAYAEDAFALHREALRLKARREALRDSLTAE